MKKSIKYFIDNDLNSYSGDIRILELLKYNKKNQFKCIYCYEEADSREHIPSKIFLNEPYESNLAILPSCIKCNNAFSENEQYLACLIDYVQYKLSKLKTVKRKKIEKTFKTRPHIKNEFEKSTKYTNDGNLEYIEFSHERIKTILLKLSIGHAIYSLSSICLGEPSFINYKFYIQLTKDEMANFNLEPISNIIPEFGSREGIYISMLDEGIPITTWNIVQNGQYRFLAYEDKGSTNIRIVIGEYFYIEVIWTK